MVLDPIPQSLPVHFFESRPQPTTSRYRDSVLETAQEAVSIVYVTEMTFFSERLYLAPGMGTFGP